MEEWAYETLNNVIKEIKTNDRTKFDKGRVK